MLFYGFSLAAALIFMLGHASIFIALVNRLHSTAIPRPVVKTIDISWQLFAFGVPILIGAWCLQNITLQISPQLSDPVTRWIAIYLGICFFAAGWAIADRLLRVTEVKTTELLMSNHTRVNSIHRNIGHRPTGDLLTDFCSRLPLNEILKLGIHEKEIRLPRLPVELDGLRITHLTDLHMTGQLSRSFYEEVVRQSNEWESDLVVLTGDIVEKKFCLDWIKPTLGELQAKTGVFYVLGNHELRLKSESLVRDVLDEAGLIDMGHQWRQVECREQSIVLVGNELPWFKPAADMATCPKEIDGKRAFRVLLTHSPDQLAWARKHDCDLMLAGHTHGGQVRLPFIGPILAPSWQGSRFASGTFYYEPTLMHVSRGIAGTRPLRLNCTPELARLTLRSGLSG